MSEIEKEDDWKDWAEVEEEEYLKKFRDKAALVAMGKLLKHFDFHEYRDDPLRLARWAYDVADGMLQAREENNEPVRELTKEEKQQLVTVLGDIFSKEFEAYKKRYEEGE